MAEKRLQKTREAYQPKMFLRYLREYDIKADPAVSHIESRVCDVCGELVLTTGSGNFMIRVRHEHCAA